MQRSDSELRPLFILLLLIGTSVNVGCSANNYSTDLATVNHPEKALQDFSSKTGLHPLPGEPGMMEGNFRGFPVLFRAQMGDVWGRYAARMAVGEVGRELGRVGQFLSGSYPSGVGSVVGSPLDRLLSQVIGQPLTFYLILKLENTETPRLDIVSGFSKIAPQDSLPKRGHIGFKAGEIYSNDQRYAELILADASLVKRIAELRTQYIRIDEHTASFIFSGSEADWSAMLREQGGYPELILYIMEILADLSRVDSKPTC